jgi:hypothetical protein
MIVVGARLLPAKYSIKDNNVYTEIEGKGTS